MPTKKTAAPIRHIQSAPGSDDIEALIGEHEAVLEQYRAALKKFPKALCVTRPFHPSHRAEHGKQPAYAQQAAIDWREQLRPVMQHLREYFALEAQEDELRRYPVAEFGRLPNFGYEYDDSKVIQDLSLHIKLLRRRKKTLDLPMPKLTRKSLPGLLKEARTNAGDDQETAAMKCYTTLATYKSWEQGRRFPHAEARGFVKQYIRLAGEE